jgi:hypothetical protein
MKLPIVRVRQRGESWTTEGRCTIEPMTHGEALDAWTPEPFKTHNLNVLNCKSTHPDISAAIEQLEALRENLNYDIDFAMVIQRPAHKFIGVEPKVDPDCVFQFLKTALFDTKEN